MTQPVAGFGFLPWLRRGLAGQIGRVDGDPAAAPRAAVDVTVVVDAGGEERPLPVHLPLLGPGDVTALHPRAVIRVAPKPGELDAEPNELPMVEFAEPDLPWRYTPAVADANRRLRPWLVLAVLRDEEIAGQEPAGTDGRLPVITVSNARRAASARPELGVGTRTGRRFSTSHRTTVHCTSITVSEPACSHRAAWHRRRRIRRLSCRPSNAAGGPGCASRCRTPSTGSPPPGRRIPRRSDCRSTTDGPSRPVSRPTSSS